MADMYADPNYVFPADGSQGHPQDAASSPMQMPSHTSMTGVFSAPATPSLSAAVRSLDVNVVPDRSSCLSPCGDNVMSVTARDGEELHYPVVHGRAGGSLVPQTPGQESSAAANAATRADAAARAHRHASLLSGSAFPHNSSVANITTAAAAGAVGVEGGRETPAEMTENYQQSRATPSSIRRHRHSSRGTSRSPPPAVALRGEPVEDTARATSSPAASLASSPSATPRQSLRRTPSSTPFFDLGDAERRQQHHHALVDGVSVRVEETGVSTPEMAEYFADNAADAQMRSSAGLGSNVFGGSSSSLPSRRAFVTPRHSQQFGAAVPTVHPPHLSSAASAVQHQQQLHVSTMERLMHLLEEQSAVSQQVLTRLEALEGSNKELVDRLGRLERTVESSRAQREEEGEGVTRVSAAESASPSVTRTSGSMDSAARPSTRAPSKAVN